MIGTAGASGGSASSSMKIMGTLDTSNIDRSFSRVKQGFKSVEGVAKGFTSDLVRMGQASKTLASKLVVIGGVGAGALVTLASKAPAVAPAMAKIGVAFGKIGRELGESLAPAFEKASGWLDKIAVWQSSHPNIFTGLVVSLSSIAALKFVGATGLLNVVGSAIVSASTLTALSYLAAIGGAGYAGYKGAEGLIDKLQNYTGMGTDPEAPTDMSGQTLVNRLLQKVWSSLTGKDAPWEDQFNPNSPAHDAAIEQIKKHGGSGTINGRMDAAEDRRGWFLQWWQATWG